MFGLVYSPSEWVTRSHHGSYSVGLFFFIIIIIIIIIIITIIIIIILILLY